MVNRKRLITTRFRSIALKLSVLIMAILAAGCGSPRYASKKMASLNKKGYQTKLNGVPIDAAHYFLDKENLKKISIIKEEKIINLFQKNVSSKLIGLNEIMSQFKDKRRTERILTVINGIPINDDDVDKIRIEVSIIKSLDYLTHEKNVTWHQQADVLLIQAKE